MSFPPVEEQLALIRRGVEKIVPEEELAKRLKESRDTDTPLRIKYGIDPTGIDVHLGHTVPLRKMRQFQDLGHQAVVIIGNYTALVGDPSGRDETRARLTPEQVETNAKDYLEQVGKVVDLDKAEIVHNGDWFGTMSFLDILELCSKVTLAQLLTRDDFSKRFKAESPIYLHECLYPLMQAWDSVKVKADIELGGTEQLYSFMLARDFQRNQGMPGQIGVMSPILVGTDGLRRMGKSLDNYIGISESPLEMTKKIMRIPDEKEQEDGTILPVMQQYFELLTDLPLDDVERMIGENPKQAKLTLAKTIVAEYCAQTISVRIATETDSALPVTPQKIAKEAADRWQREVSEKKLPEHIPEAFLNTDQLDSNNCMQAAQLMKELDLVPSTSEATRRIKGGAAWVLYGDKKKIIVDRKEFIEVQEGMIVRAGKKDLKKVRFMNK